MGAFVCFVYQDAHFVTAMPPPYFVPDCIPP